MDHQSQFLLPRDADLRDALARPLSSSWIDPPASSLGSGRGVESQPGLLLEYWGIIRRRMGTLLIAAFLGALAAFLISLFQPRVYQARGSVEIQELNEDFLNIKQVNPLSGPSPTMALSDIETQIKILQSESLLDRVLGKLSLRESGQPYLLAVGASGRPHAAVSAYPSASDDVLGAARRSLQVRQAGETRIVEVLYDSPSPELAAQFVNALVNEFIDQNVEARWKTSLRTGDWLGHQLDEIRTKLQKSEDSLQSYARKSGLILSSDSNSVAEERLRKVQEALLKAQSNRMAQQSRYEMSGNSAPETLPDVLNDSSLRAYQSKIADLRQQRAELAVTYSPEYSKLKKVDVQIASLESDLQRERGAIIRRIKNEYDEALKTERLLTADYSGQTERVNQEAEKAIQYHILKREVDTNRQLYDALLQRLKEANIASAMRASNIRVVDPARVPSRPYKPKTPLNTGLGLLTGVFLGIAFILVRERADRSIRQPGDLDFFLNLPELGVIPTIGARPQRNGSSRTLLLTGFTGGARQELSSLVAESFRAVLTSILLSSRNGRRPRSIVITSANRSEGKSMVSFHLAIALAAIGDRVLLIDGDFWKPVLHKVFDVPNDAGFADLLGSADDPRVWLSKLVHQTEVPGLSLLPAGRDATAAVDLLHSRGLPEVLELASRGYDSVVIDSPPVLEFADARVLGHHADGVILVARVGSTTREAALAARNRLAGDSVPVIGTILNDWKPRSNSNGYYASYRDSRNSYPEIGLGIRGTISELGQFRVEEHAEEPSRSANRNRNV